MYINAGFIENQDGSIVTTGADHFYLQKDHSTGYNYSVFTASGSLTVLRSRDILNCSILVVGGGGSGGGNNGSASGGGGGAGGQVVIANNVTLTSNQTYSIVVGAGGAQSTVTGNPGTFSSWNNQYVAQGGAGGGAGIQGLYVTDQIAGAGAVGTGGGGSGGRGGVHGTGDPSYPSPGINGEFGKTGTYNDFIPPQSGSNDAEVQRVRGYFSTGGGGGEFQTRWDGGIGYAGGTTPWFVDPRYYLGYNGPYYGSGIGKLLTTPEGDSSYSNYAGYAPSSWRSYFGDSDSRVFVGGNGGPGAQGIWKSSLNSSGGQNGIVILKYRL